MQNHEYQSRNNFVGGAIIFVANKFLGKSSHS